LAPDPTARGPAWRIRLPPPRQPGRLNPLGVLNPFGPLGPFGRLGVLNRLGPFG